MSQLPVAASCSHWWWQLKGHFIRYALQPGAWRVLWVSFSVSCQLGDRNCLWIQPQSWVHHKRAGRYWSCPHTINSSTVREAWAPRVACGMAYDAPQLQAQGPALSPDPIPSQTFLTVLWSCHKVQYSPDWTTKPVMSQTHSILTHAILLYPSFHHRKKNLLLVDQ